MGAKISHDRLIAEIAARQYGNITRTQLLDVGLSSTAIAKRIRTGRLYPVYPGVYAVGRPPSTPLERVAAALLACGPGAALSHRSAGTLWGWWKRWDTPFHVIVPGDRRPDGIVTHRPAGLTPRDLTVQLGLRVTSPARTALDCAPRLSEAQLARAVNEGRLARHLSIEALADVAERFPRHRGAAKITAIVAAHHGDGPTRSPLEDEFAPFCREHGLPVPRFAVIVAGHEVDALFEAERLIVELDGWEFHRDRAAFEADRDRDADTLAAGFETVRITRERLRSRPDHEAARLRRILSRG